MAEHQVEAAYKFETMQTSRTTTSVYGSATQYDQSRKRGPLANPLLINNLVHTGRGDLWLPPAATEYVDLTASIGARYVRSFHSIQDVQSRGAWTLVVTTDATNYRIEKVRLDGVINSANGL